MATKKPAGKKKPVAKKAVAKKRTKLAKAAGNVATLPPVTAEQRLALSAAVEDYASGNYPAREVVHVRCPCTGEQFEVQAEDGTGALRRCVACKREAFFADSEEHWDEADPGQSECTCEGTVFHAAVGFARTQDAKDVKWIYVGLRCVACGLAGVYVDWKIDYSPSLQLLEQA